MQKIGDIPNTRADSHGEFTDGNVAGGVPQRYYRLNGLIPCSGN